MSIDVRIGKWTFSVMLGLTHPTPFPPLDQRLSWVFNFQDGCGLARLGVLRPFIAIAWTTPKFAS